MIFFNGASKGNPGTSRTGGIIYSTDGQKQDNFCWGLGQSTNNHAKFLSLLKACQLAQRNIGENLKKFRDSEILIKTVTKGDELNNSSLNKTLERMRNLT